MNTIHPATMEVFNYNGRPMRLSIMILAWAALLFSSGCGGGASSTQQAASQNKAPVGSLEKTASIQTPAAPAKPPNPGLDPCAVHLHDEICPALLLYLASHADQLPAKLTDLRQSLGFEDLDITCPVTHQPYGYEPLGLIIPDDDARVVVADTKPIHGGVRWAIRITPRIEGRPPSASVIPMTEEMFSKLRAP